MSKTKRQLRAEAVERLERMDEWCDEPKTAADFMKALLWDLRVIDGEHIRDALVDLLTDPEPPEGDPVRIMREVAHGVDVPGKAMRKEIGGSDWADALIILADMVERDYIRREEYEVLANANARQARKISNVCDLNDELRKERDELAEQNDSLREWKACYELMKVERDEWKARAERGMTNLERLYENDEFFNRFARLYATVGGTADDDVQADEWLMAEHVDDCGRNADMSGNAPGCVRNDASASQHGVSDGAEGPNDTREKLEADVLEWCRASNAVFPESRAAMIRGWLDRQEAITELEEREQWLEELSAWVDGGKERIAELQHDVDVARMERDECVDAAEKQVRQLEGDLKGARKSRDHWQRVASKHDAEVQRLKGQLKDEREYGAIWPRFEDGALVKFGDSYMNAKGNAAVVRRVSFLQFDGGFKYRFGKNDVDCWRSADAPVKRPLLMAADGQPIEVGQVLYGESDGKAWTVDRIDHGQHHPVMAHNGRTERGLKA